MASNPFPNRPFNLRDYVYLVSQDVAANRSLVGWQLWVDKTSTSPTSSGGAADRQYFLAGIKVGENLTPGFNFTGSGPWLILEGQNWIDHLPDGTQEIPVLAAASYDILGYTEISYPLGLPPIPRASTATFTGGTAFDAGTAVTINTNRASSGFTHDIKWSFGSLTNQTSGLAASTGVGASTVWTPPLSMLAQIPTSVSGSGTLTVTTKNGSTVIGTKTTPFTLRAGAGVVPTISSLSVSDGNPTVASIVGAFVQGLSSLTATVNAAGVQGSTISARSFTLAGTTVASGGSIGPIAASGTVPVTASATDSRGRSGAWSGNITVLPYVSPLFTNVLVRRSSAAGVLSDNGTSLRVDLNCAVQSLVNSTQRNSLTIRVFTRPYGGTTWTARNVITAGALTYNTNFVISGGANYPIDDAFDVRVEIADKFQTAAAQTVVATAAVFMHWSKTGVGVGKYHQNGALDVAGDIYTTTDVRAAGEVRHRGGYGVEPVGMLVAFAGTTAPDASWLLADGTAVSRATYPTLFARIGTTYGAGNGSTTFNLPNLKGRVPVGRDAAQTEFDVLGETGGAKTHTLLTAEMPAHNHAPLRVNAATTLSLAAVASGSGGFGLRADAAGSPVDVPNTGGGGAHNNLQPFLVLNYIIKAL